MIPVSERMQTLVRALEPGLISADSRNIQAGSVFFAIRGTSFDGHDSVEEVLSAGAACCVVSEDFEPTGQTASDLEQRLVRVADTREAFAWACCAVHRHPSRAMLMFGVTGTSGKTTTTFILESILKSAGHRVGVIGTVSFRIGDRVVDATHTTPGSRELQSLLAQMRDEGCTAVVMEVSSHALSQFRTAGVAFDGMVFTNLSPEHLDYHANMEDYYQAKKLLFGPYVRDAISAGKNPQLALNVDDSSGIRLARELQESSGEVWTFSLSAESGARLSCEELCLDMEGTRMRLVSNETVGGGLLLSSPLVARFNASNILGAAAISLAVGVDQEAVVAGVAALSGVPGRLERVPNAVGLNILVDYAHKPDALEKVLLTLQQVRQSGQRILTVVGCGGDRDRTKRPVMGELAERLSDLAVITSDNPRTEPPRRIIDEVLSGVSDPTRVAVCEDRRDAILEAVRLASPGDIILIAGKGHEDYQILADPTAPGGVRKVHFDDREVAAEACSLLAKS